MTVLDRDKSTIRATQVMVLIILVIICAGQVVRANEEISIALEDVDIKDYIRWAGEQLNRNVILPPSISGRITVLAGGKLSESEAYEVFRIALAKHGFAIVDRGSALEIVPSQQAINLYAPLLDQSDVRDGSDIVLQVLRPKSLAPTELLQLIRPLMSKAAITQVVPNSNVLILGDRFETISRVMTLVEQVDRKPETEIRFVRLKYGRADGVLEHIRRLFPDLFTQTGWPRVHVTPDQRTNSIALSGNSKILTQIAEVIAHLDRPRTTDNRTQVIPIEYQKAQDLVPALKTVADSLAPTESGGRNGTGVSISVNDARNSLIVTGSEQTIEALKEVIFELDQRQTQVLVEAIIVEVSLEKMMDLGIRWRSDVPNNDGVFAGGNLLGSTDAPTPPLIGSGLTLGFFSGGDLRGLIRAIATDADTNFLSTPTIVTLDNHEAEILVGENIPLITGSSTGSASSTDNPFQTIQRQDIGVSLRVIPQVNADDSVTLTVDQSVETVSPSSAVASDIVTSKRQIKTTVLMDNDEVLVLGGLIRDDISQQISKVPFFGDIPVIGRLFRSTSDEVVKRNLMVFLHPRILTAPTDHVTISKEYWDTFGEDIKLQKWSSGAIDGGMAPHGEMLPTAPSVPPRQ